MTSHGLLLPLITQPTRLSDTSKTLIDNIYTNVFHKESISGNILIEIADHLAQFASFEDFTTNSYLSNGTYLKRDTSNFDSNLFLDDLSIQPWATTDDPDLRYGDFMWRLEGAVDRHQPMRKLTPKEIKEKKKPWITRAIILKIRHRNAIFARSKSNPNDLHL